MSGQSRAIGRHGKRPSGGTSTGNESLSIQAQRVLARFASSLDETASPPSVQRALDALRLGTDGQHLRLRDMLGLASAMARKVGERGGSLDETRARTALKPPRKQRPLRYERPTLSEDQESS